MKYTKEHVLNNKVVVICNTKEEKIETLKLLMQAGGIFGGVSNIENVKDSVLNWDRGYKKVGRWSPERLADTSICHDAGTWYEDKGYVPITAEQFIADNQPYPQYEIY